MIVTRRLNDVYTITRFTLKDCKNARLRGNDKLHFQCLLALCLDRDTAVFLVDISISFGVIYRYGRKTEPICRNFQICWVFYYPPGPYRQKFKILAGSTESNDDGFGAFFEYLVEIGWPDSENFC